MDKFILVSMRKFPIKCESLCRDNTTFVMDVSRLKEGYMVQMLATGRFYFAFGFKELQHLTGIDEGTIRNYFFKHPNALGYCRDNWFIAKGYFLPKDTSKYKGNINSLRNK